MTAYKIHTCAVLTVALLLALVLVPANAFNIAFSTANVVISDGTSANILLPAGYLSYAFAVSTSSAPITSVNWTVDTQQAGAKAVRGNSCVNVLCTSMGHTSGMPSGNVVTASNTQISMVAIGSNVQFSNAKIITTSSNSTGLLSINYSTLGDDTFVVIIGSIGGAQWETSSLTIPNGCTMQQNLSQSSSAAFVATCFEPAGTYTASTNTKASKSAHALMVYLFPANYTIKLDDSPSTGSTNFNGVTYASGSAVNAIGTATINAIAAQGYVFSHWAASNSLNVSIANTVAANTLIAIGGNDAITAVYNSISVLAGQPTPSNPSLDNGQSITLASNASGGPAPYTYQWYSGASSTCSLDTPIIGANSQTYTAYPLLDTYFCYKVTDSASPTPSSATSNTDLVTINNALISPLAPTVTSARLDADQALTVNGIVPSTGTPPYSWQWLYSTGGAYISANGLCATGAGSGAVANAPEQCAISANTLTVGDTYSFELRVTDSANTPETMTSSTSSNVVVAPALISPSAPTVSSTAIYSNQSLMANGIIPHTGMPPYSWQWLYSTGGAYISANGLCATGAGSGAVANALETCSIPASTLTAGENFTFEFMVTDSASVPETQTSSASNSVAVSLAPAAFLAPTVSASKLDSDQVLVVNDTIPSLCSPHRCLWQWLTSLNGGTPSNSTQCEVNSGAGARANTVETCSIPTNTLTAGSTYAFKLRVTLPPNTVETSNSSTNVIVAPALTNPYAPIVSATKLDANQALTVNGITPSTGTSPYAWQFLTSINGGAFTAANAIAVCPTSNNGIGASSSATESCSVPANTLTADDTYAFEFKVTDSANTPETQTSSVSSDIVVANALTAASAPTVSATKLDSDQAAVIAPEAVLHWMWKTRC